MFKELVMNLDLNLFILNHLTIYFKKSVATGKDKVLLLFSFEGKPDELMLLYNC